VDGAIQTFPPIVHDWEFLVPENILLVPNKSLCTMSPFWEFESSMKKYQSVPYIPKNRRWSDDMGIKKYPGYLLDPGNKRPHSCQLAIFVFHVMEEFLGGFQLEEDFLSTSCPDPTEKQNMARNSTSDHPLFSWGCLSNEEKVKEVGDLINLEISEFLLHQSSAPTFEEMLHSSSSLPPLLQLLLSTITKNKVQDSFNLKMKKILAIGHAVLKARDPRKLSPYLLSTSISLYSVTGSRFVLDLLCTIGFGASYISVRNFLSKFTSLNYPPLSSIENVDVIFWADNIQTICGSSRSTIAHSYSVSVVTNHVTFLPETKVQSEASCDPMNWQLPSNVIKATSFLVDADQEDAVNHFFTSYLEELGKK